ncbi:MULTISPECIES: sensor histidine kinase [Paenibacillus]|uniref:sensor histidine kinase n=1 Tax=Paenibacillus TaxID=44249 RepID=UPI0022B858C3|nr:HAMP domain-containing sensor histidine kinase [Paenibacillus caseinilyticus]MCZ8518150.1 HAMP domain-containing sensor histidine kinase [Paenibacillus caseinilyticus]
MRGSLYTRIILSYLISVILGLFIAFYATGLLFADRIWADVKEDLHFVALDLIDTYKMTNGMDINQYLEARVLTRPFYVSLIDAQGGFREYGYRNVKNKRSVSKEAVQKVLAGGIHYSMLEEGGDEGALLGYPMEIDGRPYALFIQPAAPKMAKNIRNAMVTALAIQLAAGSVFILIGARYLVNPLKLMTRASRRIAKGDFNISLDWRRRRDELGELAVSFTEMAGELKQMERMRQDFVSNVSHEIQSPLTSIAGFSKVLQERQMGEEERVEYLRIIQTEAQRLSRLSENLLKLASLESEHHPFHPQTYDLDEQLRGVILSMEPIWSAKDLELHLELPSVKVHGDPDQLSQVWMNLIGNAMKFTPAGGTVRIHLKPGVDQVTVKISDTGIGFSGEEQARLFERFYKADRSRSSETGGSGLGLSIVKKIIDLHGGTVEAASRPGEGAEFTVTLPHILLKRRE